MSSPANLEARRETIYDFMEMLLTQINATFDEHGIALPERQFFDTGANEAPHDCEQVTIAFQQMYNGLPGVQDQTPTACAGPRTASFVIEVVRCTPVMERQARGGPLTPPSIEKLNASTKAQVIDAWLLTDAALLAAESFAIAGGLADTLVTPESGGYQAVVLNLAIGLQ